jgi:hypothetical protein
MADEISDRVRAWAEQADHDRRQRAAFGRIDDLRREDGKHADGDDDADRSNNGYKPRHLNNGYSLVERRYFTTRNQWRTYLVAV